MTLAGTVAVTVDGEEYDVPLTVWLTDSYPVRPPPVYVTPGPGTCWGLLLLVVNAGYRCTSMHAVTAAVFIPPRTM